MVLKSLQHIGNGDIHSSDIAAGRDDTDRDRVFIRIDEAAADIADCRITSDQHSHAFTALDIESLVDHVLAELNDFLTSDSHLGRIQFLLESQLLGKERVDAVRQNDHVRVHRFAAGIDPDDLAVL